MKCGAVLLKSESTPDYYWMDHFSGDSEMLIAHYDRSMTIDADEENRKEFAIEGLLQRQKYNAAFNVAIG
jgi:hypothetical protein